jgi:hypothetical protein
MEKPVEYYWSIRLENLKAALEKNNFEVFITKGVDEAKGIAMKEIIPKIAPKSISWGGSMTFMATGLHEELKKSKDYEILDTYDRSRYTPEEMIEMRRQALLVDLFITGTNAVTENGKLVNLDMNGNRNGGITFGPKNVIIFIGRNKVVPGLEEAMTRIKTYAAPINAMRLDMKTPCKETGRCVECKSSSRICNVWTITEKSFPKGRIKVVVINQDLGL